MQRSLRLTRRYERRGARCVACRGVSVCVFFVTRWIVGKLNIALFADQGAAAGTSGDQPREDEVVLAAVGLRSEAAIKDALHLLP
jgi:hemolysin activation/secretion protein